MDLSIGDVARLIGLPVGILLGVSSLAYLGTFWVKRILRKA